MPFELVTSDPPASLSGDEIIPVYDPDTSDARGLKVEELFYRNADGDMFALAPVIVLAPDGVTQVLSLDGSGNMLLNGEFANSGPLGAGGLLTALAGISSTAVPSTIVFDRANGAGAVTTGLRLLDTDSSHTLKIELGQNLSANRRFILGTPDANFTLDMSAVTGLTISIDGTLASNSDAIVPTQKAIRTYVTAAVAGLLSGGNTWAATQIFSAIPGLTGGGIAFPATQVPSADPNTLDDYEEGTFTPTLTFGGGSTGMTGTFSGRYTKIGRQVFVQINIVLTAKGSSTGAAAVGTMPFTSAATFNCPGTIIALNVASIATPQVRLPAASTGMIIYNFASSAIAAMTEANFQNNSEINIGLHYTV